MSLFHWARQSAFGAFLPRLPLLGVLGCLFAPGCSQDTANVASKQDSVTIAMPLVLHSALVLLARDKGYFAQQGLNVTVKPMASGAAAIEAMQRGEADLALNSETAFMLAALERKDVRLLTTLYRSRANMALVARKDLGIARALDLAGKRIGIIPNTGAAFFADLYLTLQGIEPGRVTRVPLGLNEAERALMEGKIDAAALFHPHSSRLVAQLGERAVVFNDPAVYQMQFNLVARQQFVASRPDAARRFILALDGALAFLREHPQEAARLTIKATGEDPEAFGKVWRVSDFTLGLNQSLISVLEDEARWAIAGRRSAGAAAPNFLKFVEAGPLQSVRPDAVAILLP